MIKLRERGNKVTVFTLRMGRLFVYLISSMIMIPVTIVLAVILNILGQDPLFLRLVL